MAKTKVMIQCKICKNKWNNKFHKAKEMNFGMGEIFDYMECGSCGCVQLLNPPHDMTKYYPPNYYSTNLFPADYAPLRNITNKNIIKKILLKFLTRNYLNGNIKSNYLLRFIPRPFEIEALANIPLNNKSKILDIGCGNGWLMYFLKDLGYYNVSGIDPNIENDIFYNNGLIIKKCYNEYSDIKYDIVLYNHSFEHISDPNIELVNLRKVMHEKSVCMIRIPIASFAWWKYGIYYYQLDAPRHFFLHSLKSIRLLLETHNFGIIKINYESTLSQFWISELLSNDISIQHNIKMQDYFNNHEINYFRELSELMKASHASDQISIYITKK